MRARYANSESYNMVRIMSIFYCDSACAHEVRVRWYDVTCDIRDRVVGGSAGGRSGPSLPEPAGRARRRSVRTAARGLPPSHYVGSDPLHVFSLTTVSLVI